MYTYTLISRLPLIIASNYKPVLSTLDTHWHGIS